MAKRARGFQVRGTFYVVFVNGANPIGLLNYPESHDAFGNAVSVFVDRRYRCFPAIVGDAHDVRLGGAPGQVMADVPNPADSGHGPGDTEELPSALRMFACRHPSSDASAPPRGQDDPQPGGGFR
jgi:hypothetical protein